MPLHFMFASHPLLLFIARLTSSYSFQIRFYVFLILQVSEVTVISSLFVAVEFLNSKKLIIVADTEIPTTGIVLALSLAAETAQLCIINEMCL